MSEQENIQVTSMWECHFHYKEGKLFWCYDVVVGKGRVRCEKGKEAGGPRKRGRFTYWAVSLQRKRYYRHRVVWEIFNGKIPEGYVVNHLNGIPGDDRIENLEIIPRADNNKLHKAINNHVTNKSGKRGVCYDKARDRWSAEGWDAGKKKHLGRYSTFEEACKARSKWESEKHNLDTTPTGGTNCEYS